MIISEISKNIIFNVVSFLIKNCSWKKEQTSPKIYSMFFRIIIFKNRFLKCIHFVYFLKVILIVFVNSFKNYRERGISDIIGFFFLTPK